MKLTEEDRPLAKQELGFWYIERYQPGYNSRGDEPIEQRMQAGGTLLKIVTDKQGTARVQLPERFDKITNPHLSYQFVVRFNMNRADPTRKPYQTPQFEFYAYAPLPPALAR